MRLLLAFILIPAFGFGQIFIGPLTEGEYYNEVVYEGVYSSPGNCTWNDGIDFYLDFSGLTEIDGMEYAFIVDTPDPSNTTLMNGWLPVSVGDSTIFTPSTIGLGISAASNPAQLYFHIRLIGTPTTAGQNHPCWIDAGVTEALCDNSYALLVGETPIACFVQTDIGIKESDQPISIRMIGETITIDCLETGEVSILTTDGKLISKMSFKPGTTQIEAPDHQGLIMIQVQTTISRFSKKILLQK